MRNLLLFLAFFALSGIANAQVSTIPMPTDANHHPLSAGLGPSYATSVIITATSYDFTQTYQVPSDGNDASRAYRHLYVLNRSLSRTLYVCLSDENSCTLDAMILRPGYGAVFEPILFGKAVGKEYIYFKLDSAGTVNADVSVW